MFSFFLLLHLFGVIVGSGPTFIFPIIQREPKTVEELRFVHRLMGIIGRFPFWGDVILFVSGVGMMWALRIPFTFTFNWLTVSIVLFVILRVFSSFVAPIFYKKADIEFQKLTNEITSSYIQTKKAVNRCFWFGQSILLIIILLMVLKPF